MNLFFFHFRKTACLEEGSDVTSSDSDLQHFSNYAHSASSEAQEQYSSEDDNGDLPTTEINTEKKQDDYGISKQIKGCRYYKHSADTNYGTASVTEPSGESRILKWIGCKTRIEDHYWGIPVKYCVGFEKFSPKRKNNDTSPTTEGTVITDLTAKLEALERQEQELLCQEEENHLRRRISNKRKAIEDLRQASFKNLPIEDYTSRLTVKDLPKMDSSCPESRTPLDDLLASWDVAPSQPALSKENGPDRPGFPTP